MKEKMDKEKNFQRTFMGFVFKKEKNRRAYSVTFKVIGP